MFGPDGAYRRDHLQNEAHALGEAASVLVVAVVAERGEELICQISIGGVELTTSKPAVSARLAAATESAMVLRMSSCVMARGVW